MLANISFKLLNKCLGLKYFNKCLPKTNLTTKNKIQAAVARADTIKESGTANCEKLKLPSKYWNCSSLFIEIPIGALIGMTTNKGKTRNSDAHDVHVQNSDAHDAHVRVHSAKGLHES